MTSTATATTTTTTITITIGHLIGLLPCRRYIDINSACVNIQNNKIANALLVKDNKAKHHNNNITVFILIVLCAVIVSLALTRFGKHEFFSTTCAKRSCDFVELFLRLSVLLLFFL
jgi:hypothetical protein